MLKSHIKILQVHLFLLPANILISSWCCQGVRLVLLRRVCRLQHEQRGGAESCHGACLHPPCKGNPTTPASLPAVCVHGIAVPLELPLLCDPPSPTV